MFEINFYGEEYYPQKVDLIITQYDISRLLERLKVELLAGGLPFKINFAKNFLFKLFINLIDFSKIKVRSNVRYIVINIFDYEYIIEVKLN